MRETGVPDGRYPDLKRVYHEPREVQEVLRRLFGVDERPFLQALEVGWLEWANRSEFDASSFPGTLLWGHAVRAERTALAELGWTSSDENNFAVSISPDQTVAIAVETGDKYTATIGAKRPPRTSSKKGTNTMQMIADNRHLLQGNLFDAPGASAGPSMGTTGPIEAPLLWVHLIHQTNGDIVSEISLPITADDSERIVGWQTRIILPRWRGDGSGLSRRNTGPEAAPDADLQIIRRRA